MSDGRSEDIGRNGAVTPPRLDGDGFLRYHLAILCTYLPNKKKKDPKQWAGVLRGEMRRPFVFMALSWCFYTVYGYGKGGQM